MGGFVCQDALGHRCAAGHTPLHTPHNMRAGCGLVLRTVPNNNKKKKKNKMFLLLKYTHLQAEFIGSTQSQKRLRSNDSMMAGNAIIHCLGKLNNSQNQYT